MTKLLIDTSIVIDHLRRKNKEESLFYKLSKHELFISIITHTELCAGKNIWKDDDASRKLKEFFANINILSFTIELSEKAGYIKAHDHSPDLIDCIIAATAIEKDYELVTLNVKDFKNIPNLKLFDSNKS